MKKRRHTLISLCIMIGLIMFCRGVQMTIFTENTHSTIQQHSSTDMATPVSCCDQSDEKGSGILMEHTDQALLPSTTILEILFILLSSIPALGILIFAVSSSTFQSGYGNFIRARYGGWRFFVLLVRLFKNGILHPKIFA